MTLGFDQLDVFASGAFTGNPVAVVHDAFDVTTEDMHRITEWTNLSEATFLLPPTEDAADYRVRIFCPGRELPFAGHPTLGTAAAWLASGGTPKRDGVVVQECGAGLVAVRVQEDRLAFAAPPMTRFGAIADDTLDRRLAALGIERDEVVDASWIDNGPGWLGIVLESADRVLDVPLPSGVHDDFDVGLVGPHTHGECAIEVRGLFADANGSVREDPVTGSLNASVAQWLIGAGRLPERYMAAQGTALGRAGRVHVEWDGHDVWIGGEVHRRISGTIAL